MEHLMEALMRVHAPAALVIRHGARYPATDMDNEMSIGLTERGMIGSRLFGINLTMFSSVRIFYSPALRCKQTANCIAAGLQCNGIRAALEERSSLCAPYVKNSRVMEDAGRLGQDFIQAWFDSKIDDDLIYDTKDSVKMVMGPIFKSFSKIGKNALDIHISHDWDITLIWKELAGIDYKNVGWPGYLSGLLIYIENDSLRCVAVDAPLFR